MWYLFSIKLIIPPYQVYFALINAQLHAEQSKQRENLIKIFQRIWTPTQESGVLTKPNALLRPNRSINFGTNIMSTIQMLPEHYTQSH